MTLTAASNVAGEMPAADPDAPWLVLYALVTFTSGNPDALRLRAEWLPGGGSTWVAGDMHGLTAPVGSFTQLGISAKPGVMQGVEVLVQRPAGLGADADGVRLVLQKVSAVTTAVDCDVHLVGLRKASDAEIAAEEAAGALAAAVSTLSTTITGVSDALAALQTSLVDDRALRRRRAARVDLPDRGAGQLGALRRCRRRSTLRSPGSRATSRPTTT